MFVVVLQSSDESDVIAVKELEAIVGQWLRRLDTR